MGTPTIDVAGLIQQDYPTRQAFRRAFERCQREGRLDEASLFAAIGRELEMAHPLGMPVPDRFIRRR